MRDQEVASRRHRYGHPLWDSHTRWKFHWTNGEVHADSNVFRFQRVEAAFDALHCRRIALGVKPAIEEHFAQRIQRTSGTLFCRCQQPKLHQQRAGCAFVLFGGQLASIHRLPEDFKLCAHKRRRRHFA